jgi:hypothetical protein
LLLINPRHFPYYTASQASLVLIQNHHHTLQLTLLILAQHRTLELPQDVTPGSQIIDLLRRKTTLLQHALKALKLLIHVIRIRLHLFRNLGIVFRKFGASLFLRSSNDIFSLVTNSLPAINNLLDDAVNGRDRACGSGEFATLGTVRAGFLVDEVNEGLLRASAFVRSRLLGSSGKVLDCWVRLDALLLGSLLGVWGLGVDLGDDYVGFADEVGGQCLPGRC